MDLFTLNNVAESNLNKKKIIWIGIVTFSIIAIIACSIFFYFLQKPSTLLAKDNSFTLTVPAKIRLIENQNSSDAYIMDFYAKKENLVLYASKTEKKKEINLSTILTREQESTSKALSNFTITNSSIEISIPNVKTLAYSYSFHSQTINSDLIGYTALIESDKAIYCITFYQPTNTSLNLKEIAENILKTFVEK